jgi:hypothetical protein
MSCYGQAWSTTRLARCGYQVRDSSTGRRPMPTQKQEIPSPGAILADQPGPGAAIHHPAGRPIVSSHVTAGPGPAVAPVPSQAGEARPRSRQKTIAALRLVLAELGELEELASQTDERLSAVEARVLGAAARGERAALRPAS